MAERRYLLLDEAAPVLVIANKQDVFGALPAAEVANRLGLHSLPTSREWRVVAGCATAAGDEAGGQPGGGTVGAGLDWLSAVAGRVCGWR